MPRPKKCVFTTTTAIRGSDWGVNSGSLIGGVNEDQYGYIMNRVESALETVAPCAAWYPALSEVHACLTHAEALADLVDGESPDHFLDDEDFEAIWDLADDS